MMPNSIYQLHLNTFLTYNHLQDNFFLTQIKLDYFVKLY